MSEAQDTLLAQLLAEEPHGLLTQLAAEDPEDHPAAEWLTAYHADELPAEEAAELQAHLAVCSICTRALLDLPRFYQEAAEPPSGSRFPEDRRRVDAGPPPGTVERRLRIPPGLVAVLAAGLFGCLIGFPLGLATHPKASHPPPAVAALSGEVTRGQEEADPLILAGISQTLVWPLPEGSPPRATYRIEIQSQTGTTLLSAETAPTVLATAPGSRSAVPDTPRSLAVELPLEQLAPGPYRLVLTGLPEGEPLDQRPLRIRAAAPRV